MKEFKHLDFPRLREYYTKYPQGYTIYESLLDILEHINEVTDVVNLTLKEWEQIETWVLNELKQYSIDQLQAWLDDGTLEQVINDALFESKADKTVVANLETQLTKTISDIQSKYINVKYPPAPLVGAKGDGTDETDVLNNILKYTGANVFVFPKGDYVANIEIPRSFITLIGEDKQTTTISSFDVDKPTITTNKNLYIKIKGLGLRQKYGSDKPCLDMKDSRYCNIEHVHIKQNPNESLTYSYTSDGIDMRNLDNFWVGYNRLKEVYVIYCRNGLNTGTGLNSVLSIEDSLFSYCGLFGLRLDGVSVGFLSNLDVANNGVLGKELTPNEKMYGGIYINGSHIIIQGVWNEYNRDKYDGQLTPNNIYIHPDSTNISYYGERDSRSSNGARLFSEDMGVNQNIHISDIPVDDGMGREKTNNLVINGSFKHWRGDRPIGWNGYWAAITTKEMVDLPVGFDEGLRMRATGTGIFGVYQYIYKSDDPNSIIKDITNHVGKYITITMWVKNLSPTAGEPRAGFDTGTSDNVYFSEGQFHIAFPYNQWVKMVLTRKITGTEGKLAFGIRSAGEDAEFIITGVACSLSTRVGDSESKSITEDGGIMFNDLEFAQNNKSIVLTSPNNSKYRLSVGDDGTLTATPI